MGHAAGHATLWGSDDAAFFGTDSEHHSMQKLDCHAKVVAAAKLREKVYRRDVYRIHL
jgi:hypothetical protein